MPGNRRRSSGTRRAPGRARGLLILLPALALGGSSCGSAVGLVELNWQFLDASASDRIEPTCHIDARDGSGSRDLALRVRLTVSRTDAECSDATDEGDCLVAQEVFPCDRLRGTIENVPASDEDYLITVDVVADPAGGDEPRFVPPATCVTTPGPRTRRVEAGRISDLGVYEIIVHAYDEGGGYGGRYNLQACGPDA